MALASVQQSIHGYALKARCISLASFPGFPQMKKELDKYHHPVNRQRQCPVIELSGGNRRATGNIF